MEFRELEIPGAWVFTPTLHHDARGLFLESFTRSSLREATGRSLELAQANISVSSKGTIRGIHYALVPPGQAKYVQCVSGSAFDVVLDVRVGSPTFGQWTSVILDTDKHSSIFLSEGLGHGFQALEESTTLAYFCSAPYAPEREFGVNPFDPDLGIAWPTVDGHLSEKDRAAPDLSAALDQGALPDYQECADWMKTLLQRED